MKLRSLLPLCTFFYFSSAVAQELVTSEEFNDITELPGWEMVNMSSPAGDSDWFQGNVEIFPSRNGEEHQYIAANHRNVESVEDGSGVICNYLIMPDLGALESLSFHTRSAPATNNFNVYPDRLYVVRSPDGGSETGNCTDGFGDFSETLMVINEDLSVLNYPDGYPLLSWQPFEVELNGTGRIAFVYYVEDAGFYGTNSNYVGIDSVEWVYSTQAPFPGSGVVMKPGRIKREKDLGITDR